MAAQAPVNAPLQLGVPPAAAAARDEVAVAQMRRDRARLAQAQAEILALRAGVTARRAGLLRRVARRVLRLLPGRVQHGVAAWRGAAPAPVAASVAAPATRGRALVIDDHWPRPDRDAGSIEIVNLVQALEALGFEVRLAAGLEHAAAPEARQALEAAGLRCLSAADAPSLEAYLAREGHGLDLCVLCRVYCGGRFLEGVLAHARAARVVFHSIDLHYLRLERHAQLEGGTEAARIAEQVRTREQAVMRGSDATVVVSETELAHLRAALPEVRAVQLPLARRVAPPAAGFAARRGIGFIGSFAHAPNLDAMRWFLAEVWPLVLRGAPDMEMTVVGAGCPPELLAGVPGQVRALGHVPDVGPWFEGLRLTVAPLRFGAGAKGKVASSLAAGVPVVATAIAAEGMALSEDAGVLVADDAAGFAARVLAVHGDAARWAALSRGGLAYAEAVLSVPAWRARLDALLRDIGL